MDDHREAKAGSGEAAWFVAGMLVLGFGVLAFLFSGSALDRTVTTSVEQETVATDAGPTADAPDDAPRIEVR